MTLIRRQSSVFAHVGTIFSHRGGRNLSQCAKLHLGARIHNLGHVS